MSKTIAELRASGHVRRRTRAHTICLDVDLSDEYRRLREELFTAAQSLEESTNSPRPPGRLGRGPVAALTAARAEVEALGAQVDSLAEQMAEFEVEVTLQQAKPAEWNEWIAEHPPRQQEADEAGQQSLSNRDSEHGGYCNFDELIAALPAWITVLNGAPATAEDWEWVASQASPRDLDDVGDLVVALHTGRVSIPKSLTPLLATLLDDITSEPPRNGEQVPDDSTAGNPSGKPPTNTTTPDD